MTEPTPEYTVRATEHRIAVCVVGSDRTTEYRYHRESGAWTCKVERSIRSRDGVTFTSSDWINRPVPQWAKEVIADVLRREEGL